LIIPAFGIANKPVPGPPKRFAQMIGLAFSVAACTLFFFGQTIEWKIVLGILSIFAALESFVGFCAGCFVFYHMMSFGIIPVAVCERCNQIQAKL
ncbi:MAG: DUF4395 domain-containing protein, partial [Leptospira sp.]|nr:DUF4395 domain-containing protein [Leptospira sp.]